MISIGAIYKGPELQGSDIQRAISAAGQLVAELRGPLEKVETPWVNAVLVVAGSLGAPDFSGCEYGEYSRTRHGVVVQIAIGPHQLAAEDPVELVIDSLRAANAMAFEFFRQEEHSFPLRDAEAMVTAVAERLRERKTAP